MASPCPNEARCESSRCIRSLPTLAPHPFLPPRPPPPPPPPPSSSRYLALSTKPPHSPSPTAHSSQACSSPPYCSGPSPSLSSSSTCPFSPPPFRPRPHHQHLAREAEPAPHRGHHPSPRPPHPRPLALPPLLRATPSVTQTVVSPRALARWHKRVCRQPIRAATPCVAAQPQPTLDSHPDTR